MIGVSGDKTHSSRFLSIDGDWQYFWSKQYDVKPPADTSTWQTFATPGHFEYPFDPKHFQDGVAPSEIYAYPIYTNIKYPFHTLPDSNQEVIAVDSTPIAFLTKKVTIPAKWKGQVVFIHFGSVRSNMYLEINGHAVGYSEGSKVPTEFDITQYVTYGEDTTIQLRVMRFCSGSYLEDQDMWRLSGFDRESFVYARPPRFMSDLHIEADYSERTDGGVEAVLNVAVLLEDYSGKDSFATLAEVKIKLIDADGVVVINDMPIEFDAPEEFMCHEVPNRTIIGGDIPYQTFSDSGMTQCASKCLSLPECTYYVREERKCKLKMNNDGLELSRILKANDKASYVGACRKGGAQPGSRRIKLKGQVKPWTAETPNTYALVATMTDADGSSEVMRQTVGFRTVSIEDGALTVNGIPIVIKGVNRHEHNMRTGHIVSKKDMLEDIKLMKSLNINAVRASHYPNHEDWYELCTLYGLYVFDEANLESHGAGWQKNNWIADNPEWRGAHVNRVRRMFERDKNHASIIAMSLGNEAGTGGNLLSAYKFLKERQSKRPIVYTFDDGQGYTDITFPMYV